MILKLFLIFAGANASNLRAAICLGTKDLVCGCVNRIGDDDETTIGSLRQSHSLNLYIENCNPCNFSELADAKGHIEGKAVILSGKATCSIEDQILYMSKLRAGLVIFVVNEFTNVSFHNRYQNRTTDVIQVLKNFNESLSRYLSIRLFDPYKHPRIDVNVILLIVTASGSICLGMWWGVYQFVQTMRSHSENCFQGGHKTNQPSVINNVTIVGAVLTPVLACTVLLLAYFFPRIISYILFACYAVGGSFSMTICLMALFEFLPERIRSLLNRKLYKSSNKWIPTIKVNFLCAFPISLIAIALFFVLRFTIDYAWPVQWLIGVCICVVFTANARIKKFHIIIFIYVCLFVYDIFFVFVSPHIRFFNRGHSAVSTSFPISTGTTSSPGFTDATETNVTKSRSTSQQLTTILPPSVIEYVTLGLGIDGQLPIVFSFPYFIRYPNPCETTQIVSVLGLGDVLFPGLLGMYCAIYDYVKGNTRYPVYSIVFLVSYIVALLATFSVLSQIQEAQPALLYITPITVPPILITAAIRGDFKDLFNTKTLTTVLNSCEIEQSNEVGISPKCTEDNQEEKGTSF